MQRPSTLPLYTPPAPSATLVQTLLTCHPYPSILKLLLPLNIIFALTLINRHLPALIVNTVLLLMIYLPAILPFLTPKLLLLLPLLFLPLVPLSLVSLLLLLLVNSLLHATTSYALPLLTALGATGARVTLSIILLYAITTMNPRRRRRRPRRRVPPSPWPERPHLANWAHDDTDDVKANPAWKMPAGLATRVPRFYRRLGHQYHCYQGIKATGKRRVAPEALRLGTNSFFFKFEIGGPHMGQRTPSIIICRSEG